MENRLPNFAQTELPALPVWADGRRTLDGGSAATGTAAGDAGQTKIGLISAVCFFVPCQSAATKRLQ